MKKIFAIIIFGCSFSLLSAQELNFEYGKLVSSFRYTNSNGEKMANLQGTTNNHLALGWKGQFFKAKNLSYIASVSHNKYAAVASDTLLGNYYNWQANYLGLNLGLNYEFFRFSSYLNYFQNTNKDQSFSFFLELYGSSEFFIQGNQTINKKVYSLKGVEQFNKPLIFANGGIGMVYYASGVISIFAKYNGSLSFSVFKSTSNDNEKLNYLNQTFSLGLALDLMLVKKGGKRRIK